MQFSLFGKMLMEGHHELINELRLGIQIDMASGYGTNKRDTRIVTKYVCQLGITGNDTHGPLLEIVITYCLFD